MYNYIVRTQVRARGIHRRHTTPRKQTLQNPPIPSKSSHADPRPKIPSVIPTQITTSFFESLHFPTLLGLEVWARQPLLDLELARAVMHQACVMQDFRVHPRVRQLADQRMSLIVQLDGREGILMRKFEKFGCVGRCGFDRCRDSRCGEP